MDKYTFETKDVYAPFGVDWAVISNECEYDDNGNLILDYKAAFNFEINNIIIIGFIDDFGDISNAKEFKVIKKNCGHLVCKPIEYISPRRYKMDINNILGKIENYKAQTAEKAEQERIAEEHNRQSLLDKIRVMKPDIDNLIKVAKTAQEAGIPLKAGYMIDKTYDNGDFFADAMTHKVGFIQASITNQEIIGVGFEGGGCCGNYDFFTNGLAICDKNRDNGREREAITEHLEKFIEKFPEFEKAFCDYIGKATNSRNIYKRR